MEGAAARWATYATLLVVDATAEPESIIHGKKKARQADAALFAADAPA